MGVVRGGALPVASTHMRAIAAGLTDIGRERNHNEDRFILLPEGEHANVISFSPPLTIPERDLDRAVCELGKVLRQ